MTIAESPNSIKVSNCGLGNGVNWENSDVCQNPTLEVSQDIGGKNDQVLCFNQACPKYRDIEGRREIVIGGFTFKLS